MTDTTTTRARGNGNARAHLGHQAAHVSANREALASFIGAMFRYADAGTFASLRTFTHRRGDKPVEIRAVRLGDDLRSLVAQALGAANRAAQHEQPTVFAPPVATFAAGAKAREADLANGLAISIELDARPAASIATLEAILGRATVVVASGGEWADPETGEIEPKLHAHWRLVEPTRTPEDHARLKRARGIATALVGGDGTAVPLVHPLRWPGSWHRKGEPRLATIERMNEVHELELGDAIERLEAAARARLDSMSVEQQRALSVALALGSDPAPSAASELAPTADEDLGALADTIPADGGSYEEWIKVGYAFHAASAGSEAGFAAFDAWSRKSVAYGGTRDQWAKFADNPPERTGIGALIKRAKVAKPGFRLPSRQRAAPEHKSKSAPLQPVAGTDYERDVAELAQLPEGPERENRRRSIARSYNVRSSVVDKSARELGETEDSGGRERTPAARDKILLIAADWQLWHDQDGAGYCTLEVDDHLEHLALRSRAFRDQVTRAFGRTFKTEVEGRELPQIFSEQAFLDARRSLEAAAMDGPEHVPWHRVGGDDEKVVYDLGRPDWLMVEVTSEGWKVVSRSNVKMIRTNGMRPQPLPEPGGDINRLKDLLNFGHVAAEREGLTGDKAQAIRREAERAFRLFVGSMVVAMAPAISRFVFCVSGEHGSGKSTMASTFKQLIDPHRAQRRSLPQNSQDLFIAASSTHCLLFDNVSELPSWLADDLSRIATGGSLGKRTRYSDAEETYLTVRSPIVLNGIPDLATRADLADRALVLNLPAIPEDQRRTDAEIEDELDYIAPSILGSLLDGVAAALRNREDISELIRHQPQRPRMLDATVWAEAAGEAFGWERWTFLADVNATRGLAADIALEADIVAEAVCALIDKEGSFSGKCSALLERLTVGFVSERIAKSRGWPKTGHHLSSKLRRCVGGLRRVGIEVEFDRDGKKRWVRLKRTSYSVGGE